jgi:hypothetical protein
MKFAKSILICSAVISGLSLASCSKWLDVNVDPENPTSESAEYQQLLPHIEFYMGASYQMSGKISTFITGDWMRAAGSQQYQASIWNPTANNWQVLHPYQWFLVGAGPNLQNLYDKALADGAYHYAGVAKVIKALGFMMQTDVYGEMPYSDALGENTTPKYDTGKEIYQGCLKELDEGIELLGRTQEAGAVALSVGDYYNSGDTAKWIKFAYLLKARWINKLIKKGEGSIVVDAEGNYTTLKWDATAILDALSKGPKSNADNTIIRPVDEATTSTDVLGWAEPVNWCELYSIIGCNGSVYPSKTLYDNLTNFCGLGIEDPRADRILPWETSIKGATTPAEVKWVGNWRRSLGVDMTTQNSPMLSGGPIRAAFKEGKWYIDTDSEARKGDTLYVEQLSSSTGYDANVDIIARRQAGNDNSMLSGTFGTRVDSPMYLGIYPEACFIAAEVYMKQGNTAQAYASYKEGVKASMELMNEKLPEWTATYPYLASCPSFAVITDAEINNYINNALGTAANISMGKILTQKRIAMMFMPEVWNDMRRYDFDKNLFFGWDVPAYHAMSASGMDKIPAGKFWRRVQQCSHEVNYNATNLQAVAERIQYYAEGINMTAASWNAAVDVWTIPVWWDTDKD